MCGRNKRPFLEVVNTVWGPNYWRGSINATAAEPPAEVRGLGVGGEEEWVARKVQKW